MHDPSIPIPPFLPHFVSPSSSPSLWFFLSPGESPQVPHLSPADEPQALLSSQQEAPHLGIWGLRAGGRVCGQAGADPTVAVR